jgi:hypothetical protein
MSMFAFIPRLDCGVRAAVAVLVLAVVMTGCSRRFPMAEVSGKVTLDGKPLSDATVMFVPEKGFAAAGTLQPDGNFRLISGRPGNGAVIGSHKVAVMPANPLDTPISMKFRSAETSGLSVEVKAGKNSFEFDLTSDEGKQER